MPRAAPSGGDAQRDPIALEVARIAHDLNNILGVINCHAEEMLQRRQLEPADQREAGDIQTASMRGGALMKQLLNIGSDATIAAVRLELNEAVREHAPLLCRLIGKDMSLDLELANGQVFVEMGPDDLTQIIMNLVTNARDSRPRDARIVVRTTVLPAAAGHSGLARLSVIDTGCGMPAGVKERIFEAYFTTKTNEKGTGLGLTTVYDIASRLNATIDVVSYPDQGTGFSIDFLLCASIAGIEGAAGAAVHKPELASARSPGMAKLTVLLAEDEHVVRNLLAKHIKAEGHHVLVAEDGEEALQVSNAFDGDIHILVTDIVMPKMGGAELAQAIREHRPETKIIYMSGYAPDADTRARLTADDVTFLAKPFAFANLRAAMRQPAQ
jgi:two-component system, cell cycle sensor histidine kinase and response regulator CckA